jgi:ribosomal-protein-alanine N-acetyltransferase
MASSYSQRTRLPQATYKRPMTQPDSTALVVRPAVSLDLARLVAIDALCFSAGIAYPRAELAALLCAPSVLTLVAESSSKIAGFAALGIRPAPHLSSAGRASAAPEGELITIDVHPEFRRQGVGGQLHHALEDWLRAAEGNSIELHVAVDNTGALQFYKKLGYIITKRVPRYYLRTLDAWHMEKNL